jgi:hypothetical protein
MWDHCNSILHDTQLESSHKICDAQINKESYMLILTHTKLLIIGILICHLQHVKNVLSQSKCPIWLLHATGVTPG